MPFRQFHPKAYLTTKRNVSKGLRARTKILEAIEKQSSWVNTVAVETGLSYSSIRYHLRTLRKEGIVESTERRRPRTWKLTNLGQQRLLQN